MSARKAVAQQPRQVPFPWGDRRPMNDRQRTANYEHDRVTWNKEMPMPESFSGKTASNLRDAVLKRMAPDNEGPGYDPASFALLTAFETALRQAWEDAEVGFLRQRIEQRLRAALETVSDGKLL